MNTTSNVKPLMIMGLLISFILIVGLACNMPSTGRQTVNQTQVAINMQATEVAQESALNSQRTQAALDAQLEVSDQNATEMAAGTAEARNATQVAFYVQRTSVAQQELQLTQAGQGTQPEPTMTLPPANPSPTQPAPTDSPMDLDAMIAESEILLFEDIVAEYQPRYIKEALDTMGLDDNYTDVKDAIGHLKTYLLSGTKWDLVIIGVEARTVVQGEYFTYLNDILNDGTAVILEHWNLDDLSAGKAATILGRCGVKIQSDWFDPPDTNRSIWFLRGEHPVFHEPNEGISLANYTLYWFGDAGDLMSTIPGSEAEMLAGIYAQEKNSYGTVATCIDGRMIIQTHSTHDYHREDSVRLWQNYIFNALRAHYEYLSQP